MRLLGLCLFINIHIFQAGLNRCNSSRLLEGRVCQSMDKSLKLALTRRDAYRRPWRRR